jgi:hypothetical protein
MCSVYPEAQKGGGWRLGRRDKLRIFRVRVEDKSPVEWLTSHLLPDRIIWSSHPALLKPDITFDFSAEEHLLQEEDEEDPRTGDNNVDMSSTPMAEAACEAETQKRIVALLCVPLSAHKVIKGLESPFSLSLSLSSPPPPLLLSSVSSVFKRAARLLNEAPAVLVMAGAGMGKDSGLPDYRFVPLVE